MAAYIFRRLLHLIPSMLGVIIITFALGYYGPGDPLQYQLGQEIPADPQQLARMRQLYGLDRPFDEQLASYIVGLAQGNMGISLTVQPRRPISSMLGTGLSISMQLGGAAALLIFLVGVPLGMLAAYYHNTVVDYVIVSFSALLPTVPVFVLAPLLLILLVLQLKILPYSYGWAGLLDSRALLPLFILVIGPLLTIVRQTRSAVLEAIPQDYVRTAQAKGLSERRVMTRHILKNALAPVVTSMGFIAASLLTGSLFVESIFGIPGFGKLIYDGLKSFDYPLILGTTLVSALFIMVSNFVVDLIYPLLDPRVRPG